MHNKYKTHYVSFIAFPFNKYKLNNMSMLYAYKKLIFYHPHSI